ncbi:hypothetical protein PRIEUP_LOCUS16709, partial [Pristimantis euphronides]
MEEEDGNLGTFLAYTKSPKTTKKTPFQDELKKKLSARMSRQKAMEETEYSDKFESDDSLDESFGKTKKEDSKVQKDLNNFHFSDNEEDPYGKTSFLKKSRQAETNFNKHSEESKSRENISQGDQEDELSKSGPFNEVNTQQKTDDKHRKPIPKPRESRNKSSPSSQDLAIFLSNESFNPIQLHSNLSGKSSHLEDKAEGKYSSDKPTSLSAPSSLMRLNDKVSASETQSFSERCSPEGHQLSSPPSATSELSPLSVAADENDKSVSKEKAAELVKDLQIEEVDGNGNKESSDNGRKSPSLFVMMISDVKEKSVQQDTKEAPVVKTHEGPFIAENRDDNEKIEQDPGQVDHQNNLKATFELGRVHSNRSLTSSQTKKSPKLSTQVSAKSRYLGTLTVLDTSVNIDTGEVEAADKLRATVYQNWLEKKETVFHELQKLKKAEKQLEKAKARQESTIKKEDSVAAFMAWKAKKTKEIKHRQDNQKMEENNKMEELQETARRKEECRKAFEKWKEAKEECVKEKILKEKHTAKEKERKEQKAIAEKKRESKTAFERWNDRKEHVLKERRKQVLHEKQKLKTLKTEREEQEKRAMEIYEQWLDRKEAHEKIEKQRKKFQAILDDDPLPPWSPPGKTVPSRR